MDALIRHLCLALIVLLSAPAAHARVASHPSPAPERFHLSLHVGEEPRPQAFQLSLRQGQHGEIELAGGDGASTSLRLAATIISVEGGAGSPFRRTIGVQVSVHEQVAGAWVLRGETLLQLREGRPSREVLDSPLGPMPVVVSVNGAATASRVAPRRPLPTVGRRYRSSRTTSGSGTGLPLARSIQTITTWPSAYSAPEVASTMRWPMVTLVVPALSAKSSTAIREG